MQHPNAALVQRFYDAFARRDAEAMAVCYHKDVVFRDPVFGELRGDDARDMWRMLCARGKDLTVVASRIRADDVAGSAHWVAHYSFGKAQRKVVNAIDARFEFRDGARRVDDESAPTPSGGGLIAVHEDAFDLWKWSRQALGPTGLALGWTPMVQRRVRAQALDGLRKFQATRRAAQ